MENLKVQPTVANAERTAAQSVGKPVWADTKPFWIFSLHLPLKSSKASITGGLWLDHDGVRFLVMPLPQDPLVRKTWGSSGTSPSLQNVRDSLNQLGRAVASSSFADPLS